MSFIGIDLGTSYIKGAVLNLETRQPEHIRRIPFPDEIATGNPHLSEFDPRQIVAAARTLIDELSLHTPECEGIVMCSQMHGMVLMNAQGEVASNCISWRDRRGLMMHPSGQGSYFDVLSKRIGYEQRRQLGNELEPGRPACFLFWLAEQRRLQPDLIPVSIPDFALSALCGSAPGLELTNASACGLLNLETLDWHWEVIGELGLDRLRWPTVRNLGEVAGRLALHSRSVPCYTPIGDYQCALLGTLLDTDEISLNISTGAQVSRLTMELSLGAHQTRPFFDGKFLNAFSHPPGGRSLNVIVDLLGELADSEKAHLQDPWRFIAHAAREVVDTDLVVDLDFFSESLERGGTISNIRGDNLRVGHIFRAAFNNMADNYHACALQLWPERAWTKLVLSGGLALKLEALRESIQRKFQSRYRLSPCAEDTLFGLLILALVFSGRMSSPTEAVKELRSSLPS